MYRIPIYIVALVLGLGLGLTEATKAGPTGHWAFDEGAGHVAYDSSGNGNHGTLSGDPAWVTGRIGSGALNFDDIDDIVLIGHDPSLDIEDEMTIALWVNTTDVTNPNHMVTKQPSGTAADNFPGNYEFRIKANTIQLLHQTSEDIEFSEYHSTTQITADEWHHAAVSITEGGLVKFYLDGTPAGTATQAGTFGVLNDDSLRIGGRKDSHFFNGQLDDVRIYDRILTDEQIEELCNEVEPQFLKADKPQPDDGDMLDWTYTTLRWRAGDLPAQHNVYLGTNPEAVANATPEDADVFLASIPTSEIEIGSADSPYPTALVPGMTYYWRVDEVNDAEPDSPWQSEVWSFRVRPLVAWDPVPADGLQYVHPNHHFAWEAGMGALLHRVYLGESFDEVNDATTGNVPTVDTTYAPDPLELGKTYYWRIDEYDGVQTVKGEVWSLTTVGEIEVTDPNRTGWWTFDEGEGLTAVDWSGYAHHGMLSGAAEWTDGFQGGALTFADDVYVETAYPGITGTASRTCSAWIKTASRSRSILSWGADAAGKKWLMRVDDTAGLRIEVSGGYNYGVTNLADDQWHHVAVVLEDDGSPNVLEALLYVDGEIDANAASADKPVDTSAEGVVRIGESPWHNRPWIDQIDDVRIYDRALTEAEIGEVMRGNVLLASGPYPARGAIVDVRDASSLNWQAGDAAVSHDVYFGTDKSAVAGADQDSPEYQGNQATTSFSLTNLVEIGGGDYFWRIDEVASDGTVEKGDVWAFTVPNYLIVDDFESYTNDSPNRVFQTWVDGLGFSPDEHYPDGNPGNGTGAMVGHDIWTSSSDYFEGQIVEVADTHSGQAMPIYYDNSTAPYNSEAERTWTTAQNWTVEGVSDLTLYVRGEATNDPAPVYVIVEDSAGHVAVAVHSDAALTVATDWVEWKIPLSDLTNAGVSLTAVKKMYIGVGSRTAPTPGGSGVVYIDDILVTMP